MSLNPLRHLNEKPRKCKEHTNLNHSPLFEIQVKF